MREGSLGSAERQVGKQRTREASRVGAVKLASPDLPRQAEDRGTPLLLHSVP